MPSVNWLPKDGALVWKNMSGVKSALSIARVMPMPSSNWAPWTTRSGSAFFIALTMVSKFLVSIA